MDSPCIKQAVCKVFRKFQHGKYLVAYVLNNVYFDTMVSQIYPSELQLNKANTSDTEAAFLDLHFSISNDSFSSTIYNKRKDFISKL